MLMQGNEAVAQGAIDAGCRHFFGYPITPQNPIGDYMAEHMPRHDGVFLQAESELAAANMVYGAAAAGARAMTASSSPGISLKQEAISYMAECELPAVIANIARGGSGLGNIAAAGSDYFQTVKGGGHGDYRTIALAPWSVQEMYDLTRLAFDLADTYRTPVIILADAMLGMMMEPMTITAPPVDPATLPSKPWATNGAKGRPKNIINSLYIVPQVLEEVNLRIQARHDEAARKEVRWQETDTCTAPGAVPEMRRSRIQDGAELLIVAFGTAARVCKTALERLAEKRIRVGMLRPITLWPYPYEPIRRLAERVPRILVVELSLGQMVEDVRLAVEGRCPVHFFGRTGGMIPTPTEVAAEAERVARE
jgi:2-oxoglutarate ferredoxin oxidoreductase subunit alpha